MDILNIQEGFLAMLLINNTCTCSAINTCPFQHMTISKFNNSAFAIPIMNFLPPEGKSRAFHFKALGEEGLEPPTPWFVATCSNPSELQAPLRLHWICSREHPQKGTFPQPFHFG